MAATPLPYERFQRGASPATVIEWLKTHRYIYVQAPFDSSPVRCYCNSKLKLWKRDPTRFSVTVQSYHAGNEVHTIDNGVLDRICIPNPLWWHGLTATVRHYWHVGEFSNVIAYGPLGYLVREGKNPRQKTVELHQDNGYVLPFRTLEHAVNHCKRHNIRLSVMVGRRTRVLVAEHAEKGDY